MTTVRTSLDAHPSQRRVTTETSRLSTLLRRALLVASAAACGGRVGSTPDMAPGDNLSSDGDPAQVVPVEASVSPPSGFTDAEARTPDVDGGSSVDADAPACVVTGDGGFGGAGATCWSSVFVQCSTPVSLEECASICPAYRPDRTCWHTAEAGLYRCSYTTCGGRRPQGFSSSPAHGTPVGAFFARLAELEA